MLGMILLLCTSCIEPFQPVIEDSQEVMVIYGKITDKPGIHRISVSRSTPYNDPSFSPVSGCVVWVTDEMGDPALFEEQEPGIYDAYLDYPFLGTGKAYALRVTTPEGYDYHSDYDSLLACPPIDSLYYELRSEGTSDPEVTLYGIQFYCDFKGPEQGARNFRWKLEETWEYNSPQVANVIYYGGNDIAPVLGDTINTCYMKAPISELYSASTRLLSENKLSRTPLNFVTNATPRLRLQYSLLVTQESLTHEIYQYWEQMESQSSETGGFYETQPSSTVGNIFNVIRPEEKVLGVFYATQQQSRRITVRSDFAFPIESFTCDLDTAANLQELGGLYPYWLYSLDPLGMGPPYLNGPERCFDCRLEGGTTLKPEYW
jgi:hypothetical protein